MGCFYHLGRLIQLRCGLSASFDSRAPQGIFYGGQAGQRIPIGVVQRRGQLPTIGILFQTPTMLAQLMDKGDLGISAEQLQTVLKNIYEVWEVMNPAERCKLIQCVITRITVYENHIEIRPNLDGIKTLLAEAGMEV